MYSDDDESQGDTYVNFKLKYRELKKHLRSLIYENECFQDELRKAQKNFVSISRDKNYLLDRILKYEKPSGVSSDSEATESSEGEDDNPVPQRPPSIFNPTQQSPAPRKKITKRKRSEADMSNGSTSQSNEAFLNYMSSKPSKPAAGKPMTVKPPVAKKPKKPAAPRKPSVKKEKLITEQLLSIQNTAKSYSHMVERHTAPDEHKRTADFTDGLQRLEFGNEIHMSREDIERHLEARKYSPELELNTTATMPAELFSQEPDSDFEESEIGEFMNIEEDATSAEMLLE